MSAHSLQEIERNLDKVGEDLWSCDGPDLHFDGLLQRLARLHAQGKVLSSLQTTAEMLRTQPSDKSLPNHQATRVKHLIKFVFEETTRGNERQVRLRKLECNALKFCGLSYKIKDILELPAAQFDALVENVADFLHRHKLSQYLYRDDIDKAINSKFNPEDDDLFKEFLKSHVELRPAKHKRDESPSNTPRGSTSDAQQAESDTLHMLREDDESLQRSSKYGEFVNAIDNPSRDNPAKRRRIEDESEQEKPTAADSLSPSKEKREMKHMYTNAPTSNISKLPEPFITAVMGSRLWKWERSQGLKTTGCFATLFPKDNTQDVSYTIWCGNEDGYRLNDFLGLQLATSS